VGRLAATLRRQGLAVELLVPQRRTHWPRRDGRWRGLAGVNTHTGGRWGSWGARWARRFGLPHVHTHHLFRDPALLWLPPELRPSLPLAEQRSLGLATQAQAVTVDSLLAWRELRRLGLRTPIHLTPLFHSLADLARPPRHSLRGELALPPRAQVVLGWGWRTVHQGRFALYTFLEVARRQPGVALVLPGGGETAEELEAEAARLGLKGRVLLPGEPPPAWALDWLREADVVALFYPRPQEVLLALAGRAPVVTLPNPSGFLVPGENCLLAAEDELSFSHAILEVLGDRGLAERLALGAWETALRFSAESSARKLVELLGGGNARTS